MNGSEPVVLVVGAGGDLGHRIVDALLDGTPGQRVRVGVRGGLAGKHAERLRGWALAGVEAFDADLDDDASLARACAGADTVISAVQGGPEVIIDGQARLLKASLDAGVTRFVPSDFAEDLFRVPAGINPYLDWRRTFDEQVAASGIGRTHVLNGGFMEAVFGHPGLIDPRAGTITFWGDGAMPMDFTALDDVAAYLVAAVRDPSTLNQTVAVAGDRRTVGQIASDHEAATGQSLHLVHRGSIEKGYAELDRMAKAGAHPMAMLPMQYLLPMMSGEGRLRDVANDRYPAIRPTTLRTFLQRYTAATAHKGH